MTTPDFRALSADVHAEAHRIAGGDKAAALTSLLLAAALIVRELGFSDANAGRMLRSALYDADRKRGES